MIFESDADWDYKDEDTKGNKGKGKRANYMAAKRLSKKRNDNI